MKINVKDYEPSQPKGNIPAGKYPFTVSGAIEKQSKNGNDMIELTLEVIAGERAVDVYEYLVSTPNAVFKIEQFCKAVGLPFEVKDGVVNSELTADDCMRKQGLAMFKPNEKGYLSVNYFIEKGGYSESPASGTDAQQDDINPDDIPF